MTMRARVIILASLSLARAIPAQAELHVRSPIVEYGELEFEHNALANSDRKGSATDGAQSYTYSLGYGVTDFWKVELEAETGALARQNLGYAATTLENTFQLLPEGKYAINLGLFAEYSRSANATLPDGITFGPIIQKELNDFAGLDSLHTLNIFVSRDLGHNHSNDTGLFYAAQSVALLHPLFNPGIEAFGIIGSITNATRLAEQQHSLGPVLTGSWRLTPTTRIRYEAGYQVGLTSPASRGALRWKFEYEWSF